MKSKKSSFRLYYSWTVSVLVQFESEVEEAIRAKQESSLLLSESYFVHWLTTLYQLVLEWEIEKADSSLFNKSKGSTQALQGKDQRKRIERTAINALKLP